MSKRKRHDSLCSSTNQGKKTSPNQVDGFNLNEEKVIIVKNGKDLVEDIKKIQKLECKLERDSNISVEPLAENVNLVNASIPKDTSTTTTTNDSIIKSDNFSLRRKSNRIQSLKRAIVPSAVSSLNSTSTEEQSPAVSCKLSNGASVSESTSAINSSESTQPKSSSTPSDASFSSSAISSSTTTTSTSTAQSTANNQATTQNKARKIQVWTEDDTRWFFEALCEHGKDFPHIQSYIAARCEKRGIPSESIKNYEQVRHYYYRMWHKISQMLNISNVVEKGVQEIYGLINYGEIWKRFGSKFDARLSASLQQLVNFGYTVFKVKGKSVRVRTPVCNALKRIHNIDSKVVSKPTTQPIPKEITVELMPETNADWIRVHSIAQNPRLRTRLTMQHRLSTLISYLEQRWSLTRIKSNASNQLLNIDLFAEENNAQFEMDDISSTANKTFVIRLRPQNSEKLNEKVHLKSTSNSISANSYRSTTNTNAQTDLSLSAYLKNLFVENGNSGGGGGGGGNLLTDGKGKQHKMRRYSKKGIAQAESIVSSSVDDKTKESDNKQKTEDESQKEEAVNDCYPALNLFKMLDSMNEELEVPLHKTGQGTIEKTSSFELTTDLESKETSDIEGTSVNFLKLSQPPEHTTLSQWLSGGSGVHSASNEKGEEGPDEEEVSVSQNQSNSSPTDSKSKSRRRGSFDNNAELTLVTAKQARLGWTLKEAESVTIGELYLLFCCPSKIVLEYSWVKKLESEERIDSGKSDLIEREETQPDNKTGTVQNEESTNEDSDIPVMSMLQKLLLAANITLSNLKKPASTTLNAQLGASSGVGSSTTPPGGQTVNKTSRKRTLKSQSPPTTQPKPSPLLSNLIQETILGDCERETVSSTVTCANVVNSQPVMVMPSQSPNQLEVNKPLNETIEKEQFVAPMRPAPRASSNHVQLKTGRHRNMAVLDDPSKVEEVLNALKANKFRQRRPMQKPFMYNLQSKVLGSKNPSSKPIVNGTAAKHSALFVIPTSHLTSTEGQTPNQILLTDLLTSRRIPQASISLSPGGSQAIAMNSFLATATSASQLQEHGPHSMVIPLIDSQRVAPVAISPARETFQQQQVVAEQIIESHPLVSTFSTLPAVTISTTTETILKERSLVTTMSATTAEADDSSRQVVQTVDDVRKASALENDDSSVPANSSICSKPSSADVLTNSQLSWLNERDDFSLGSLIAACDIAANGELQRTRESENLSSINSDIETHMNSMANDNSVDLMAKFADLAAQITADVKHTI